MTRSGRCRDRLRTLLAHGRPPDLAPDDPRRPRGGLFAFQLWIIMLATRLDKGPRAAVLRERRPCAALDRLVVLKET